MFDLLRLRKKHGKQFIPDIGSAAIRAPFRGFPSLDENKCSGNCSACADICPTAAIQTGPLRLDLGACIFCGECACECPTNAIEFSQDYRLASTSRSDLIVRPGQNADDYNEIAVQVRKEIHSRFGRSLKLRQVSAGGCNGCEYELGASTNVNFDIGRFGIQFVASPRHADGLVLTGPVSGNMDAALRDTWKSIPEPKLLIVVGACGISGGLFGSSEEVNRGFLDETHIDLYIPGCPAHPLTIIHGILDFLGKDKHG